MAFIYAVIALVNCVTFSILQGSYTTDYLVGLNDATAGFKSTICPQVTLSANLQEAAV